MKYFIRAFIVFFLSAPLLFAEEITLTTYYPAPAGAYDRLRTVNMCVGTDCPNQNVPDDQLYVQTGVQIGATAIGSNALSVTGNAQIVGDAIIDQEVVMTPHAVVSVCNAANAGRMYFDSGTKTTKVCQQGVVAATYGWREVEGVPSGAIIMWNSAAIPSGWQVCNGTNGTPNLYERFIVGAGGDNAAVTGTAGYALGSGGNGFNSVALAVTEMPSHAHPGSTAAAGGGHGHTGTAANAGNHTHQYNTQYGSTTRDGNSTQGAVPLYHDQTTGWGGTHSHSLTVDAVAGHGHGVTIAAQGGGLAHENRPPYYALYYICKQ